MPESAALVRSLCVAAEAWPRDVAKPKLFPDSPLGNLHEPLGLQYLVCPLPSLCSPYAAKTAFAYPLWRVVRARSLGHLLTTEHWKH